MVKIKKLKLIKILFFLNKDKFILLIINILYKTFLNIKFILTNY